MKISEKGNISTMHIYLTKGTNTGQSLVGNHKLTGESQAAFRLTRNVEGDFSHTFS